MKSLLACFLSYKTRVRNITKVSNSHWVKMYSHEQPCRGKIWIWQQNATVSCYEYAKKRDFYSSSLVNTSIMFVLKLYKSVFTNKTAGYFLSWQDCYNGNITAWLIIDFKLYLVNQTVLLICLCYFKILF